MPSELARRAEAKGYEAIAITDHVDFSNIDFIIPRIIKTCKALNKYMKIKTLPGVEITHAPPGSIRGLVKFARRAGAKIVIGHGETISEPVAPGTNRAFIEARVDILAHPGKICPEDVLLARANGVLLEITTRKSHSKPNKRLIRLALKHGAKLILNNDAHLPEDLIEKPRRKAFLAALGLTEGAIRDMVQNSRALARLG